MTDLMARIAENVAEIRGRIAEAAVRSGRPPADVLLLAVTKYVGPEEIRALVAAGCVDLGESRPQQLWVRAESLADLPIRWHFIGHLQRNKVERTLPRVSRIHSVDSLRLAEAIDVAAASLGRPVPVLLEVNVSGDAAKHGFSPDEVEPLLGRLAALRGLDVCGLMCMAGLDGGPDDARRDFATLRNLRDHLRRNCPAEVRLADLSMGMSGDYEAAIEEGSTIVRVGSALFEVM